MPSQPSPKILKVGTRGSPLALAQTHLVLSKLKNFHPTLFPEIKVLKTSGDFLKVKNLAEVGGKGLFIKELEEALQENVIDVAIHSLKDIPGELPDLFSLLFFGERENPKDCFVSLKYPNLESLPLHAKVGTQSPRRKAALLRQRRDLLYLPIRGNVGTRLTKLENGEYDALILATAGLFRLHKEKYMRHVFSPEVLTPAVGQGVIAIECKKENFEAVSSLFQKLEKKETSLVAQTERAFLKEMGGDCYTPLGGHAWVEGGRLHCLGFLSDLEGKKTIQESLWDDGENREELGRMVAQKILSKGGREILNEIADHSRKKSESLSSKKT